MRVNWALSFLHQWLWFRYLGTQLLFLLGQKLPVWPKEKYIHVCLSYPWQKRRQQPLDSSDHGKDSGTLKFWRHTNGLGYVLDCSCSRDAIEKIQLLIQSLRDTKFIGNKYISIGVLSYYTHIQKPLVKLLQLHCQECGFTETAIFLLERGLA